MTGCPPSWESVASLLALKLCTWQRQSFIELTALLKVMIVVPKLMVRDRGYRD